MAVIIHNQHREMPKDALLESMDYLLTNARFYKGMRDTALRMIPRDKVESERIDATVGFAESEATRYFMLTASVARDAAQYYHPKLAAVAMTAAPSAGDLFDLLLQEIDQGPRMRVVQQIKKDEAA